MTEAELMAATIDLAHLYGWRVAHFRPAQTAKGWRTPVGADGEGFPDLVMVKLGRAALVAELKAANGRLTDAQDEWLLAFRFAGVNAYLWRPADWHDGTILATLSTA